MVDRPPFDEQSARATLYALFVYGGEILGVVPTTDEETHADGDIGHAPAVYHNGRMVWTRAAIMASATNPDDVELAKRFALDVARLKAIDHVLRMVRTHDLWAETLVRFRREFAPETPSTPKDEKQ